MKRRRSLTVLLINQCDPAINGIYELVPLPGKKTTRNSRPADLVIDVELSEVVAGLVAQVAKEGR
jgi:hypothetical protein